MLYKSETKMGNMWFYCNEESYEKHLKLSTLDGVKFLCINKDIIGKLEQEDWDKIATAYADVADDINATLCDRGSYSVILNYGEKIGIVLELNNVDEVIEFSITNGGEVSIKTMELNDE